MLSYAGYDIAQLDGQMGPQTQQAIALFEADYEAAFKDKHVFVSGLYARIEQVLANCLAFTEDVLRREGGETISDETLDFCANFAVRRTSVPTGFPTQTHLGYLEDVYKACGVGQHLTRYDFEYVLLQGVRQSRMMERSQATYDAFLVVFETHRRNMEDTGGFATASIACKLGASVADNPESVGIIRKFMLEEFRIIGDLMGDFSRKRWFQRLN
ncbi:MAG: hypothetical protein AAF231_10390 [Pseudomonadota bacterium]